MASITKQQYENLKTKAFYIKQNPGQFVDAILQATGVTVKEEAQVSVGGEPVQDGGDN